MLTDLHNLTENDIQLMPAASASSLTCKRQSPLGLIKQTMIMDIKRMCLQVSIVSIAAEESLQSPSCRVGRYS